MNFGIACNFAGEPALSVLDLAQFSLEDLGQIRVTTVSRKSENLSSAAAAIHVITQEDLRRSGVNSLPEALRMAPGLDVARANSRQWAISSRGFNELYANRLLVLLDGRTIYTPSFSGVFWEDTDALIEDIDRIEVIRGPGATLWGANAVNGVINIISKSAKDTQGILATGGGGIEEQAFGSLRYGGQMGSNAFYRVYGKYTDRDAFTLADGTGAGDSWWTSQWGFRTDWEASEVNQLTIQGDAYHEDWNGRVRRHSLDPPRLFSAPFDATSKGANILGRWVHTFSTDSESTVQSYFDRTDKELGIVDEVRNTFDIDFQHRFRIGDRHEFVWGSGYRYSWDEFIESADFITDDPSKGLQLFSAFLQDEIELIPNRLKVMAGSKLEHHDFTGFELQPGIRVSWTPTERQTLWASVSRAVRTPSRAERGFQFFSDPPHSAPLPPLPILVPGRGNPEFGSEDVIAYELGYRLQPHARVSLDLATFYNVYDNLYNAVQLPLEIRYTASAQPYLVIPVTDDNGLRGETYGSELSMKWQPTDVWRLRANYTFLQMNLHTKGLIRSFTEDSEGDSPQQQVSLWSDIDLGRRVEWGIGLRYVDPLPAQNVPGYTELDSRLAWKATSNCELSLVGRSLLDAHHPEFSPFLFAPRDVEVDRAVYGKVTLRY
ncbi:MAG: TonB-dependent receptor [Verrucomicrobia bacterium]|nr:TonB-dependent receptor [Verrucomicrobiota bacterium]